MRAAAQIVHVSAASSSWLETWVSMLCCCLLFLQLPCFRRRRILQGLPHQQRSHRKAAYPETQRSPMALSRSCRSSQNSQNRWRWSLSFKLKQTATIWDEMWEVSTRPDAPLHVQSIPFSTSRGTLGSAWSNSQTSFPWPHYSGFCLSLAPTKARTCRIRRHHVSTHFLCYLSATRKQLLKLRS